MPGYIECFSHNVKGNIGKSEGGIGEINSFDMKISYNLTIYQRSCNIIDVCDHSTVNFIVGGFH